MKRHLTDFGWVLIPDSFHPELAEELRHRLVNKLTHDHWAAGGKGTSNYVIFDPSIIEILRKYGMAPLAAGGAAATVPGLLADDQGGY